MTASTTRFTIAVAALCVATAGFAAAGHIAATGKGFNRASAIFPAGDPVHGKQLAVTCLACHGENAPMVGDPPMHQPKLQHQHPASIFYALEDYKNGSRKSDFMTPMVAALSEQDMRDLSVYLSGPPRPPRSRAPEQASAQPPAIVAGHTKVTQQCGFCHGQTGLGVMEGIPMLAGQHQDYLKSAMAAYASGARKNPTMHAAMQGLTPKEINDTTTYLSAQTGLEFAR